MSDAPRPCDTHLDLVGFKYPLPHLTQSLKRQRKTKIVAIGSSSTAGEGKIVPYPCRLELALRDRFHGRMIDVLNRGIDWLAGLPMDVVLMDLQYTTAIVKPEKIKFAEQMVSLISAAAEKANVNVLRRFALMRRWCVEDGIPIEELIDPTDGDQLHMSDWATNCVTQALFGTIVGAPAATV